MGKQISLKSIYRAAYILGVALIIASVAMMWPAMGNTSPASAQTTGWDVEFRSDGFTLDAPEHPDIDIRAQFKPPGETTWSYRQSWSEPAGGPDSYDYDFDPQPPDCSEALIRVFDSEGNTLYAEKTDLPCDSPTSTPNPTNTLVPPDTATPTNTSEPTDTPIPTNTPSPTATIPGEPTFTPTLTLTPDTQTATPTQTDISTLPTPTETGTPPTPTQTDVSTLPTPTNTELPPTDPTNTPDDPSGGGSIPSPVPNQTQAALIPVTGLDTSMQFSFIQRTLMNLGLGFLGLGLVLHGLSINSNKEK